MAVNTNGGLEHGPVKPQKIVDTAVGTLADELLIPNLFQKESIDAFRGAEDDTYSVKVEGVLPFHEYEWRSGSAGSTTPGTRQAITFDRYKERKIPVTFGGNFYQGVEMTDEQAEMDMQRWASLITPSVKAVARGLGRAAVRELTGQNYQVVIGDAAANLRGALIEARRVLNAFKVPTENRYMVVGTDFESLLLDNEKLVDAAHVGEGEAVSVLREATLGRKFGFTFIVDQTIPADAAYAFAGSAFIFLNAAPAVPASKAGQGATRSFEGVSLRHMVDYDMDHQTDRSVVNTYAGFREVKDVILGWAESANGGLGQEVVSGHEHFVRGIKLVLDGASVYPTKPNKPGAAPGTPWEGTSADWTAILDGYGHIDKTKVTASEELALLSNITAPGKHLVKTGAEAPTGTVVND